MSRLWMSFRAWWRTLTDADAASRVGKALEAPSTGPDLRVLALLQRDGRLVDFLQEEIDGYSDEQIGSAVRDIHRGCRKAIGEYLTVEPILSGEEGASVSVEPGFDPAAVQLVGNVSGSAPYRGTLKHHGWRVTSARLPALPDAAVLAPAEVELA